MILLNFYPYDNTRNFVLLRRDISSDLKTDAFSLRFIPSQINFIMTKTTKCATYFIKDSCSDIQTFDLKVLNKVK